MNGPENERAGDMLAGDVTSALIDLAGMTLSDVEALDRGVLSDVLQQMQHDLEGAEGSVAGFSSSM